MNTSNNRLLERIKRHIPTRQQIFASRWSRPFAPYFNRPEFWSTNRHQIALSVAVGLFCGLMPGPTQMLSALLAAYLLRTNLPIAMFTTLYTNPITYMPLYFAAYKIGAAVLRIPPADKLHFPDWGQAGYFSQLGEWLMGAGKPLLIGVPILGSSLAIIGYFIVWFGWRLLHAKQA